MWRLLLLLPGQLSRLIKLLLLLLLLLLFTASLRQ
jgi:hypothetical protein